jgi:hypothetical protein
VRHAARSTFGQQHGDDVFGRAVGKELALVLLVPGNAVALQQRNEVLRRVARQRRAAELRVLAHEVLVRRARVEVAVGEVAAPAARDADLLGHLLAVVDEQHLQPRWPAWPAQNKPAAPAPMMTASKKGIVCTVDGVGNGRTSLFPPISAAGQERAGVLHR